MDRKLLYIFSRYPRAGACKTRLIPALGAEGAALLQRQMTTHILRVASKISCKTVLCVCGGSSIEIMDWFGNGVDYVMQHGADLGERMLSQFHQGFVDGHTCVVCVGADCPTIEPSILDESFDALKSHDIVLGPTDDGGYYLIGMNRPVPELFRSIKWGTGQVAQQTLAVATKLGLSVQILKTLTDVDRAEDLHAVPRQLLEGLSEI